MTRLRGVQIHPRALVESDHIGLGTRVWAFTHIMRGARVGGRCNIGEGVFVESGAVIGNDVTVKNGVAVWDLVTIEDGVFLGPACVFTNDLRPRGGRYKRDPMVFEATVVRRGATVGANATIVCGHEIGEYAMIAAGAVVAADVPPYTLVAGVPARRIGYVCACGERLVRALRCRCGLRYERLGRVGLAPSAARKRNRP
jgi:UDP-2-acetamido-3-amino-2,3-dideoxy-glucuronate N-acetyltransferase